MKQRIILLIGLLLLLLLFISLRPTTTNAPQNENPAAKKQVSPTVQKNVFTLHIADSKLASGSSVIKIKEGEQITLKVISKEANELHLHGYDKILELQPNKEATLTFTANLTGRFVYELEATHAELGAIEVEPK